MWHTTTTVTSVNQKIPKLSLNPAKLSSNSLDFWYQEKRLLNSMHLSQRWKGEKGKSPFPLMRRGWFENKKNTKSMSYPGQSHCFLSSWSSRGSSCERWRTKTAGSRAALAGAAVSEQHTDTADKNRKDCLIMTFSISVCVQSNCVLASCRNVWFT